MRFFYKSDKYTRLVILLFLLLSTLMPFIELSIIRTGFGYHDSNVANSFVLATLVVFLFLLQPLVSKGELFLLFYISIKAMHGLINGVSVPEIFITLITFLLIFKIYYFLYIRDFSELIWYLKNINIFLLSLLIISSEINFIVNGNTLPLLVQNLSIVIFLSACYLVWLERKATKYNSQFYVAVIILAYIGVLFLRSVNYFSIIQMKFVAFTVLILLFFTILKLFSKYFNKSAKTFNKQLFFTIIAVSLFVVIYLYSFIVGEFSTSISRGNSGNVRLLVNEFMLNSTNREWYTLMFGYGLGSSAVSFDLSMYYGSELNTVAHSGVYIYYYEHGLLGVLLFLYVILVAIKQIPPINMTSSFFIQKYKFYNNQSRGFILTGYFIVSIYYMMNLVIISSMPGPNVFWNSAIMIYILLWIISTRVIFCKVRF
jgi:hypothetical protein